VPQAIVFSASVTSGVYARLLRDWYQRAQGVWVGRRGFVHDGGGVAAEPPRIPISLSIKPPTTPSFLFASSCANYRCPVVDPASLFFRPTPSTLSGTRIINKSQPQHPRPSTSFKTGPSSDSTVILILPRTTGRAVTCTLLASHARETFD
jgi:hypothetical protein